MSTTRIRWIMPMAVLLTIGAGVPMQAMASCTDGFNRCLNDSWDTRGFQRVLANVECFAGYVGCVRRLV